MKQKLNFISTLIQMIFCRQWFKNYWLGPQSLSNLMTDEWFPSQWRFFNHYRCGVELDSALRCFRLNVESHLTVFSSVPGSVSSHTRQCFPPCQVQCRVILDSVFLRSRFNVESYSTVFSSVPGSMSSHTRQCFPLLQVQCRVTLDSVFLRSRSNVELISTDFYSVDDFL